MSSADDVWQNSKCNALSAEVSITGVIQGNLEIPLPPDSLD